MSDAEAALTEAWQAEVERVHGEAVAKIEEAEKEVVRLRTALEDAQRSADTVVGEEGCSV
jgi:hypothetical protein